LAFGLRKLNIKTDFCLEEKSLKAQMRRANKVNASFVLVLGQEEIKAQKVTLKNFNEDQKIDVALSHSAIAHSIANKK
jgi:histidyl-tRNA synthetase